MSSPYKLPLTYDELEADRATLYLANLRFADERDRLQAQRDALLSAAKAARKFVRGRHSTLTYGPQALLDQLDAAIAAAESKEQVSA